MSKKLTLAADGATATVKDATLMEVFTTAFSTTEKLTGTYGLVQDVVLVGLGMVAEAKLGRDTWKPKLFGG